MGQLISFVDEFPHYFARGISSPAEEHKADD